MQKQSQIKKKTKTQPQKKEIKKENAKLIGKNTVENKQFFLATAPAGQ